MAVMVPFPDPEVLTVHQVWSLATVQDEFEVTVKAVDPAGVAGTFWLAGVTARVGVAPACVTVTTTGLRPVTVTVMFATREVVRAFTV